MMRAFCLFLAAMTSFGYAQGPDSIWTCKQTLDLKQISDVQPSPNGSQTALVARSRDGTETNRVIICGQNHSYLFEASENSHPSWSPNGQSVAYLSGSALYLLDVPTHTHRALTSEQSPIISFSWAPNSKALAYGTETTLQLVGLDGHKVTLVDHIPRLITGISWSSDGSELAYTYTNSLDQEGAFFDTHLAIYNVAAQQSTPLCLPGSQSSPHYSPDGKWLAYTQSEVPCGYNAGLHLALYDRATGEATQFLANENWGASSVGNTILGWTPDSKYLICCEPYKTCRRLIVASLHERNWMPLTTMHTPQARLSSQGQYIGFVAESSDTAPEAYISPITPFKARQVTHLNESLPPVPFTSIVRWKSRDGWELEGLLTLPRHYRSDKPYPLVLSVHGGPMGAWYEEYIGTPTPYPPAVLAEAGYVVLRPNPRGSTGYGKKMWLASTNDWGGKELEDLLSGVDHLIDRGIVDPNRLAIVGWSYGGYLAAYMLTKTNRFSVACVGAPITNLETFAQTSDIPNLISQCAPTVRRSPVTFADRITTPLLIQHGIADNRVPHAQSAEFAEALANHDKTFQFSSYANMAHGPGNGKEMLIIMEENVNWLRSYLH